MLKLPENLNRVIHTVGFQAKKHAPEICTTLGIIGGVSATVLACKATRPKKTLRKIFMLQMYKQELNY